ncbi:MAG: hypothetical protein U0K53_02315 [Paludibacteraceae bacterium]|nr:hypothetical protein [Paludibacteraceae bacterium]
MKQAILNATRGGLDVILSYFPEAEACIGTNKHFKMRPGESDASACIKEIKGVWYVTDFGAESKAKNCFDIVMAEEGVNFSKAIYFIADRFRVDIGFKAEINKPIKEFKTVAADAKIGFVEAVEKDDPYSDVSVLGAMVTPDVMRRYNIKSLKSYSKVFKKDNGTKCQVTISSNENFPIFMFDYGTWQKIYAPMAYDKKDRFFYVGEKPRDHVFFGLKQLQEVHAKLEQQKPLQDEKESRKPTKLDYVFICAGERDALNCIGMGYTAVWMNSETAELREKDINLLYLYAEKVINIPDIDETGVRMGIERALKHWRLHTLLLPSWISNFKDRRGNKRKDLTDFCELSSRQEFDKLVGTAVQCQFWEKVTTKTRVYYEVNTISLLWYLRCCGFARIKDKNSPNERYVRIQGYKVKEYKAKEIRAFVKEQLREQAVSLEIQRLYQDSKKTTSVLCDDLPLVEIDLDKSDHQSRIFYFENTAIKVSAKDIEAISTKNSSKHCWDKAIAPHRFKRMDAAFTLNDGYFEVKHTQSKLFASLVNASRMYWRQEFEDRATGNADEDARYLLDYKFSVYGPRLSAEEQHEQVRHLANKCYAIGYMLHQYKVESKPMAVWIMENRLSEDGESSGGSGKSFLINAIKRLNLLNVVTLQGREKGLTENKHLLDRVSCWTDILLIDDPRQYFDFDTFYSLITGNTTINRKGQDSYEIDYHDSPITVFASNFPPVGAKQGSTERRLLYMVYSDYYHAQGTAYNEFRSIADDFGKDLFGHNYTEDEYNADYNFCVDCLQMYLQCTAHGEVIRPPMENVYKRINIAEMGNGGFLEWAELYFAPGSDNLDTLISRKEAFENFRDETGNRTWSQQKFKKALAAFCENSDYIIQLDPPQLRKGSKRITRKINGVQREYFYIQTKDEVNETIKSSWC